MEMEDAEVEYYLPQIILNDDDTDDDDIFTDFRRPSPDDTLVMANLIKDFRELSSRSQSTSTPFMGRTMSVSSNLAPHSSTSQASQDSGFMDMSSRRESLSSIGRRESISSLGSSAYGNDHSSVQDDDSLSLSSSLPMENYFWPVKMPEDKEMEGQDCDSAFGDGSQSQLFSDAASSVGSDSQHDTGVDLSVSQSSIDLASLTSEPCDTGIDLSTSQGNVDLVQALDLTQSDCNNELIYSFPSNPKTITKHDTHKHLDLATELSLVPSIISPILVTKTIPSHFPGHLAPSTPACLQRVLEKFSPREADRLIGRKMGLQGVDIVYELHVRNMTSCLSIIFNNLDAEDLCRMCEVSRGWKESVLSDSPAEFRRRTHLKQMRQARLQRQKENWGEKFYKRPPMTPVLRGPLVTVKAQTAVLPPTPITSATKTTSKHQHFWQEAAKLNNDQSLIKCPRCQKPSTKDETQQRALCQSSGCGFDFCIKCRSGFHGARECGHVVAKKHKTDNTVGTKKSKKNLKRL